MNYVWIDDISSPATFFGVVEEIKERLIDPNLSNNSD